MRITKQYFLSFNNTSSTTAYINIPFKVASIHVKAIGLDSGNIPAAGSASYVSLVSDLTDYQPLGITFNDSTYYSATFQDINLDLNTPRYINGTFTFTLYGVDGLPYTPTGGGLDRIILILEFNDNVTY